MDDAVAELLRGGRLEEAFDRLVATHATKVFRLALALLRDRARAEDAAQDSFLKLWRALPHYDGRASASTWLYTITRNTCLSAIRADSLRKTFALDGLAERLGTSLHGEPTLTRRAEVDRLLQRLPETERRIMTLFYLEDRNVGEVGRMLGLAEGTIKSHLHRARKSLAKIVQEDDRELR